VGGGEEVRGGGAFHAASARHRDPPQLTKLTLKYFSLNFVSTKYFSLNFVSTILGYNINLNLNVISLESEVSKCNAGNVRCCNPNKVI
jgi:hypothetical protein